VFVGAVHGMDEKVRGGGGGNRWEGERERERENVDDGGGKMCL